MSSKIYVGNLSFNVNESALSEQFEKFGSVLSCKVINDRDTGRSKGFAFVEMSSAEEAKQAISSLDGSEMDGRNLKVNEAKPQEKRESSFAGNRW